MGLTIQGVSSTDFRPMMFAESKFGQGNLAIGSTRKIMFVGNMLSTGNATAATPTHIIDESDAIAAFGKGSELHSMIHAAMTAPGVQGSIDVWGIAVAEASVSPAQATCTLTFSGTPTAAGTLYFGVDGETWNFGVSAVDTPTTMAANALLAMQQQGRLLQVSGAAAAGVLTLTALQKGLRGNDHRVTVDTTQAPGVTVTIAGGTAIRANYVPFTGGAGSDTIDTALTALVGTQWDYLVVAQNDATHNMPLVTTQLAAEAMPGVSRLEQAMYGYTGSYSSLSTIVTTTLNDYRSSVVWQPNCKWPAWTLAARMGAIRCAMESSAPNYKWAGISLGTDFPAAHKLDRPSDATLIVALQNGVSPVVSNIDGSTTLMRGIITHCLTNSAADFRAYDWNDITVTDRINEQLRTLWSTCTTNDTNPYMGPDDPSGKAADAGVLTPTVFQSKIVSMLEDDAANGWCEHPTSYADLMPTVTFSASPARLNIVMPIQVKAKSMQAVASVRQGQYL